MAIHVIADVATIAASFVVVVGATRSAFLWLCSKDDADTRDD